MTAEATRKKLYQLLNNMTTSSKPNPFPDAPPEELAERFATFFLEKILKIRQLFEDLPYHQIETKGNVPQLERFAPLSQTQVQKVILSLKTTSCEIDPIPTHILKSLMPEILPLITQIVNVSLNEGVFSNHWKCAIVRPLLKKAGLDLIEKNYRPVSNLPFISKIVEKAVLNQFLGPLQDVQSTPGKSIWPIGTATPARRRS